MLPTQTKTADALMTEVFARLQRLDMPRFLSDQPGTEGAILEPLAFGFVALARCRELDPAEQVDFKIDPGSRVEVHSYINRYPCRCSVYVSVLGDLRTNVYCIGVAPSGAGKNHSRTCIKKLFFAAGTEHLLGGERIASGSGLLTALDGGAGGHASRIFQIDEFGDLMAAAAQQNQVHKADILTVLKHLSGSANGPFLGQE